MMETGAALTLECSFLAYPPAEIGRTQHNLYANDKQLPAKNKSRQLTTGVRAQMPVTKLNHQPFRCLRAHSQVRVHPGCQLEPGEATENSDAEREIRK